MKKNIYFILCALMLNCFNDTIAQVLTSNDVKQKIPTHQEIYSKYYQFSEKVGKLKCDPLTTKKEYNNIVNDIGNKVIIHLFHQDKKIIRIEKRSFDNQNNQLSFDMYDFDDKNNCISNTKHNRGRTFEYAAYFGDLIKFDVNCYYIAITPDERKEIIKAAKLSLDSIMLNFPEFKYSINWK